MAGRNHRSIHHILYWTLCARERTGTCQSNKSATLNFRRSFLVQGCCRYYEIRPIPPIHDRQTKIRSCLPSILRKKHLDPHNSTSSHNFRNGNNSPNPTIPTPSSSRSILHIRRFSRMFHSFSRGNDGRRRLLLTRRKRRQRYMHHPLRSLPPSIPHGNQRRSHNVGRESQIPPYFPSTPH